MKYSGLYKSSLLNKAVVLHYIRLQGAPVISSQPGMCEEVSEEFFLVHPLNLLVLHSQAQLTAALHWSHIHPDVRSDNTRNQAMWFLFNV